MSVLDDVIDMLRGFFLLFSNNNVNNFSGFFYNSGDFLIGNWVRCEEAGFVLSIPVLIFEGLTEWVVIPHCSIPLSEFPNWNVYYWNSFSEAVEGGGR